MTLSTAALGRCRRMRRIRSVAERLRERFLKERVGERFLSIGEAAVVGMTGAMQAGDTFTTHHRGQVVFTGRGGTPRR